MIAAQVLKDVLARTGVSREDFFGRRRSPEMIAARAEAIQELSKLNLSASAIGRIVGRNHVTVLYWQRPEMRVQRSAYYQQYHDIRRPERVERRAAKALGLKLTPEKVKRRKPQKLRFSELVADEPVSTAWGGLRAPPGIPAAVIEDAKRRLVAPRSLTAIAFGDPPRGYSALDRREVRP